MTPNTNTNTYSGKFIFVSGIAGGREVFLGRAIDEPFNEQITIEGKPITIGAQGYFFARPFVTRSNFAINNPNFQIQVITDQEVINELTTIFNNTTTNITRFNFPLTYRWIESASYTTNFGTFNGNYGFNQFRTSGFNNNYRFTPNTPFAGYFTSFLNSAEQFRRALFASPQVNSTTEMDKITELEGNLAIGFGKITNEAAIKFNSIITRETELTKYFEYVQAFNTPFTTTSYLTGWFYMDYRMQLAKSWARKHGKAPLVREINAFYRESIKALTDIILDHCSTLDTLITESCSQYGIPFELFGEMSPFIDYNQYFAATNENFNYETAAGKTPTTGTLIGV